MPNPQRRLPYHVFSQNAPRRPLHPLLPPPGLRAESRHRSDIELFSSDRLHPSYLGSYLGAAVYYGAIFRESVEGDPYNGQANVATATYLQGVASRLVLDSLQLWELSPNDDPCQAP